MFPVQTRRSASRYSSKTSRRVPRLVAPTGRQRDASRSTRRTPRATTSSPTSRACSSGVCPRWPPSAKRMLMSSGASGDSSSSSAGRKRYDGHGRVTSLTTIAALRAFAASSERRGAPMGSARARRISACSSAAHGAAGGADLLAQAAARGRRRCTSSAVREVGLERAVAVRDRDPHGAACAPLRPVPAPEADRGLLERLDHRHRLAGEELDHGAAGRAHVVEPVAEAEPVHGGDAVAAAQRR